MTITEATDYIEREWNHPNGVYDRVITDVPGCARWVSSSLERNPDANINNLICYWFRKT